ncbi:MAG: hypothetical protein ACI8Y4_003642 [Candidatus Poriferisodalaceae bacterium]
MVVVVVVVAGTDVGGAIVVVGAVGALSVAVGPGGSPGDTVVDPPLHATMRNAPTTNRPPVVENFGHFMIASVDGAPRPNSVT